MERLICTEEDRPIVTKGLPRKEIYALHRSTFLNGLPQSWNRTGKPVTDRPVRSGMIFKPAGIDPFLPVYPRKKVSFFDASFEHF